MKPLSEKPKLIRITTVPISLEKLLEGQLKFMNSFFEVIAISSDKKELERIGLSQGVSVYPIELTRKITPLKDLKALFKMYRFFKKKRPLIVHTHTPKAGTIGMIAAWLSGVPYRLHTVAGLPLLETTGIKRRLLNFIERITYYSAKYVYPNSKGLYDIILNEKFCHPEKLKIIGEGSSNGINTEYFDANHFDEIDNLKLKEKLGVKDKDFVFIFVGRLVSDKGINELVAAFKTLSSEFENVKLLLVGPFEYELDPLQDATMRIINEHPKIISVGYQSDVRPYFAIADALVFPSYREGFPNVVMQAGAMGLPSIVTNINGCNEIIINGKNGIIIPVKNEYELLKEMGKFLTDRELVNELSKNARSLVEERYQQQKVWNAILKEYQQLIGKDDIQ